MLFVRVAAALVLGACTVATHTDVCDRQSPEEVDVNRDPNGDQFLDWHQNIDALPGGGALIGFVSSPVATPTAAHVRYAVLSRDGTVARTCIDEMEIELAGFAELPVIASPLNANGWAAVAR